MKKIITVFISLFMIISCAFAETTDYSSMSFEELDSMKKALDAEYFSRPESSGLMLEAGIYIVGESIKPGQYYAGMVKPNSTNSNAFLVIYKDYETFLQEEPYNTKLALYTNYFSLNDDPKSIILQENYVLSISYGSLLLKTSPFVSTDYYQYEVPGGTLVPNGKYIVGVEIPAGVYNTYPGTVNGGEFSIKVVSKKEDGTTFEDVKPGYNRDINLSFQKEVPSEKIELAEGDILEVRRSIIMSKPKMLQFD